MYNGVGLPTPRGSGTNGYIQKNISYLPPRRTDFFNAQELRSFKKCPTNPQQQPFGESYWGAGLTVPDESLLLHDEKRRVEVQLYAEKERLIQEDQLTEREAERRVEAMRRRLMECAIIRQQQQRLSSEKGGRDSKLTLFERATKQLDTGMKQRVPLQQQQQCLVRGSRSGETICSSRRDCNSQKEVAGNSLRGSSSHEVAALKQAKMQQLADALKIHGPSHQLGAAFDTQQQQLLREERKNEWEKRKQRLVEERRKFLEKTQRQRREQRVQRRLQKKQEKKRRKALLKKSDRGRSSLKTKRSALKKIKGKVKRESDDDDDGRHDDSSTSESSDSCSSHSSSSRSSSLDSSSTEESSDSSSESSSKSSSEERDMDGGRGRGRRNQERRHRSGRDHRITKVKGLKDEREEGGTAASVKVTERHRSDGRGAGEAGYDLGGDEKELEEKDSSVEGGRFAKRKAKNEASLRQETECVHGKKKRHMLSENEKEARDIQKGSEFASLGESCARKCVGVVVKGEQERLAVNPSFVKTSQGEERRETIEGNVQKSANCAGEDIGIATSTQSSRQIKREASVSLDDVHTRPRRRQSVEARKRYIAVEGKKSTRKKGLSDESEENMETKLLKKNVSKGEL